MLAEEGRKADLVLLDFFLPDVAGPELIGRLREVLRRKVPVLMITGSGREGEAQSLQAGADDFVTKPFEEDVLALGWNAY